MLLAEIEGEVSWVYRQAGVDDDQPIAILELARRVVGAEHVRIVDGRYLREDADLCTLHGRPTIFVRRKLSLERFNFALAHELSEHRLNALDYREEDRERTCNVMAAAHLAPHRALRAAVSYGSTFAEIAQDFQLTQTCAALRVGEATGRPLAVVAPTTVRVRGDAWGWPESERAIRKLGDVALPEIHRIDLGDAPRRFVLLAA